MAVAPVWAKPSDAGHFRPAELALLTAAQQGDSISFRRLLDEGGSLDVKDSAGGTLLQWALRHHKRNAMIFLLKAGSNPMQPGSQGDTVIHDAARHKDVKWLKLLLEQGGDMNVRNPVSGRLPLTTALMAGRDTPFKFLIKSGADVNLVDTVDNTPLHIAGQINQPWRVLDLLQAGAVPTALNNQGQTFQRYLFMTKVHLLNRQTRRGRNVVVDWLSLKGVPIEADGDSGLRDINAINGR